MAHNIPPEHVVHNHHTGLIGITTHGLPTGFSMERIPANTVVWSGTGDSEDFARSEDLEDSGPYKPAIDMNRCGAGQGAICCKYVAIGPDGPVCGRAMKLRYMIQEKKDMGAKRTPSGIFPDCYIGEPGEGSV